MLVVKIAIPAPTNTSETQCLLFSTRIAPVVVENRKPVVAKMGCVSLYSQNKTEAEENANDVCPEGNEKGVPSGRVTFVVCFSVCVMIEVMS